MPLTDAKIKAAKAKDKQYTLNGGEGLSLIVSPKAQMLEAALSTGMRAELFLGSYPYVSLQDARTKRGELKSLIARGIDPLRKRKEDKRRASGSEEFEAVGREWFDKQVWVER
ncbi:integrase arm-type DNA-binding domain-containing protein [Desulfovibrio sp. Huiquan2017]|uniref:integrase arm-type DNA-binding domain-containing protein n=1 Tax=Desulfovibrio sp. Huiquan2017 TaxID=2816861 RepID=UPI001A935049|nr:integrase arm-type DNA-binding domain-containing protein [Desulfovibrio sp. Huiquan2017]